MLNHPRVATRASRLADAIIDSDGKLRRSPLASKVGSEVLVFSTTAPCRNPLRSEGIALEHGNRVEIPSALLCPDSLSLHQAVVGTRQVVIRCFEFRPKPNLFQLYDRYLHPVSLSPICPMTTASRIPRPQVKCLLHSGNQESLIAG